MSLRQKITKFKKRMQRSEKIILSNYKGNSEVPRKAQRLSEANVSCNLMDEGSYGKRAITMHENIENIENLNRKEINELKQGFSQMKNIIMEIMDTRKAYSDPNEILLMQFAREHNHPQVFQKMIEMEAANHWPLLLESVFESISVLK